MKRLSLIILLLPVLFSCRTVHDTRTEYVDRVLTDTVAVVRHHFDSIFVQEKTDTYQRNDTVFVERWQYVYKDRLKTDTLWRTKTETLAQTVTEVKEVEVNRLKWWQKALCWCGAVALVASVAWGAWKLKR